MWLEPWARISDNSINRQCFIDLLCQIMFYRSTLEVVLAFHRSYFCLWLDLSNHRQGNLGGLSNDRFENRGLRCILSNDRFKNEQRNRHCRMIADKNDDRCPFYRFQISKYSRNLLPNFHIFLQCKRRYNVSRKAVTIPSTQIEKLGRKLFFLRSHQHCWAQHRKISSRSSILINLNLYTSLQL